MTPGEVADALSEVFDPELGIDVVALGLIYSIETDGGISVDMTATSAACPMADVLLDGARQAIAHRWPAVPRQVTLVVDPPWDVGMADAGALRQLGLA